MALTQHLDIINAAYAMIGETPIQSLEQDIGGAQAAGLLYESVLDFNLGLYLFSFSKQLFELSVDDAIVAPASGYKYGFDLPPEALELPIYITNNARNPDTRFDGYVLLDGKVHCDSNPLWAMCRYRPDPHKWSPTFRRATITSAAAAFAVPVTHDKGLADQLRVQAYGNTSDDYRGGEMGAAIRADAFSTPPRTANWDSNPLTHARWGG